MSNPCNRVLTALSYIKGLLVEDWVDSQDCHLKRCFLPTTHADYRTDSSKDLWTEFERAFKAAWKDGEKSQSVYEQLMKLSMKELDIDSYTTMFERLSLAVGWEPDAQGTIERYCRGLKDNVHRRVINRDNEPTTMEEWKEAVRAEVHKIRKTIAAGLDFRNKTKPRDPGPFQTPRTNAPRSNSNGGIVPMEVDAATSQPRTPFKKLTDDKREQYRKEGRCFRFRQKGHMARECTGRPPQTPSSPSSAVSACTTSDSTMAVNLTPDDSVSNAPTARVTTIAAKLTLAQQIQKLKEQMSEDQRSAYLDARLMDSDFYDVGQ